MLLKSLIITAMVAAIAAFFIFDLHHVFTLEGIKAQQASFAAYYAEHAILTIALFMAVYIAVTALSLPAATLLTLLAGGLFGFAGGLAVASFASTIGATIAFLMARYLGRDAVQARYGKQLEKLNEGLKREGAFYLFALRLTPVFPFFLVNIVMGLLSIRTLTFYLVSQLGMLPGTAVYVYAGTELGQISSLSDIASPSLIGAFIALGLFPLLSKKLAHLLRKKSSAHA